jgi:hypothetical protein
LHDGSAARKAEVTITDAVVAGWTGRDAAAVEKHIRELEALGVKRPATAPIFYRVSASRLTTAETIEVVGETSGGEVEFVLLQHGGRLWVGTGSDHTDREVEKYGVTVSKQMCDKPMAPVFWAYEGPVSAMLHPRDLMERHSASKDARERADDRSGRLPENTLMFCGTLAARGGVRATRDFAFELEDPVLGRKIAHAYRVRTLPILG